MFSKNLKIKPLEGAYKYLRDLREKEEKKERDLNIIMPPKGTLEKKKRIGEFVTPDPHPELVNNPKKPIGHSRDDDVR